MWSQTTELHHQLSSMRYASRQVNEKTLGIHVQIVWIGMTKMALTTSATREMEQRS